MTGRAALLTECLISLTQALTAAERHGRHRNRKNGDRLSLAAQHAADCITRLAHPATRTTYSDSVVREKARIANSAGMSWHGHWNQEVHQVQHFAAAMYLKGWRAGEKAHDLATQRKDPC